MSSHLQTNQLRQNERKEITRQDLEADEASRCATDLGEVQPNILGEIQIRLPGSYSARDTATREFKDALRRQRGFDFVVPSGHLRLIPIGIGEEAGTSRELDFRGGAAKLHLAAIGDDATRALKEFPAERLVTLELVTRNGESLSFPLFLSGPPP